MSSQKGITPEQKLAAYKEHGSFAKAGKSLGIDGEAVRRTVRARYPELDPAIPDGMKLTRTTTLYDFKTGEAKIGWVRAEKDLERQKEMLAEAVEALRSNIGREKPVPYKNKSEADLLSCYVLTDYHIGQYSWADESGEDWNTDKAEDFLVRWFAHAIEAAPKSHTAVLAQLGDFLHYDSLTAITPTSKHLLDADARYQKIVRIAIRSLKRIIKMLLEKHEHVHIIMASGNHDLASSCWLREVLADRYQDEPRITVDNSGSPYYAHEWGKTSLFFHHGHGRGLGELSKIFASLFRQVFGRTKYSYAHMGHLHHVASKEDGLMIVTQHPTMAVKDAHSAKGGYVSQRGASVISYHKNHGEIGNVIIRPEMVL
jgi:hypothetical protein